MCTLRVKGISVRVLVHLHEASRHGQSCVVDGPSTTAMSSVARLSTGAWGTSSTARRPLPILPFSDGVWTCLLPGPCAPRLLRRLAFPLLRGLCVHTQGPHFPHPFAR